MNPVGRNKHAGSMPVLHILDSNDNSTPLLTAERASVEQGAEGDTVDIRLAADGVHLPTAPPRLDKASDDSYPTEPKPPQWSKFTK